MFREGLGPPGAPLSGSTMTIDAWLAAALADAERRWLSDLRPLLEGLAAATRALREADFNLTPVPTPPSQTRPRVAGDRDAAR